MKDSVYNFIPVNLCVYVPREDENDILRNLSWILAQLTQKWSSESIWKIVLIEWFYVKETW